MDLTDITYDTAQVQVSILDLAWGKMQASSLPVGKLPWKQKRLFLFLRKLTQVLPVSPPLVLPLPGQLFPTSPSNFLPPSFSFKCMKSKLSNRGMKEAEVGPKISQRHTTVPLHSTAANPHCLWWCWGKTAFDPTFQHLSFQHLLPFWLCRELGWKSLHRLVFLKFVVTSLLVS